MGELGWALFFHIDLLSYRDSCVIGERLTALGAVVVIKATWLLPGALRMFPLNNTVLRGDLSSWVVDGTVLRRCLLPLGKRGGGLAVVVARNDWCKASKVLTNDHVSPDCGVRVVLAWCYLSSVCFQPECPSHPPAGAKLAIFSCLPLLAVLFTLLAYHVPLPRRL